MVDEEKERKGKCLAREERSADLTHCILAKVFDYYQLQFVLRESHIILNFTNFSLLDDYLNMVILSNTNIKMCSCIYNSLIIQIRHLVYVVCI